MEENRNDMNDLISKLSGELKPVKKLPAIKWRTLYFVLSQIVLIPLLMKIYSGLSLSDFHWDSFKHDPFFIVQIGLMLIALVSSSVLCFLSIIPGRFKDSLIWIPITTIILLILSVVANYFSTGQVHMEHRSLCTLEISLLALIPFSIMLNMIKKGFFISENTTLILGSLASALFPTIVMHFTCSTHPTHVFVFHFLPLFIFAFLIPKIYIKLILKN